MPKRVLDGEGFWGSRKLRRCPVWIRREYPYLYPLADCNGSFELDIPVILGKMKPNRPDLSVRKLEEIFATFYKEGIAFIWPDIEDGVQLKGGEYVHWTGSERVGRLPRPSRRSNKYEKRLAPPLPQKEYEAYLQRFGETLSASGADAVGNQARVRAKATATDRAKEKTTPPASPAFRALTDWLVKTFQETIGKKPTWVKKDYVAVAKLKKDNPSLEDLEIKRRFVHYLDSTAQFFVGWQLGKFCNYFDSFIEGPAIRPLTSAEEARREAGVGRSPGEPMSQAMSEYSDPPCSCGHRMSAHRSFVGDLSDCRECECSSFAVGKGGTHETIE